MGDFVSRCVYQRQRADVVQKSTREGARDYQENVVGDCGGGKTSSRTSALLFTVVPALSMVSLVLLGSGSSSFVLRASSSPTPPWRSWSAPVQIWCRCAFWDAV